MLTIVLFVACGIKKPPSWAINQSTGRFNTMADIWRFGSNTLSLNWSMRATRQGILALVCLVRP